MDSNREKLVAVFSGGDWDDANVDHVVVRVGLDIQKEYEHYQDWHVNVYRKSLISRHPDGPRMFLTNVKHMSFSEWLAKAGRHATDDDIEVFET